MNKQGFTLIETLITLSISMFLMLLPMLSFRDLKEKWLVECTFAEFSQCYQHIQQSAVVERRQSDIVPDVSQQTISFSYYYHGEVRVELFKLPKEVELISSTRVSLKGETGVNRESLGRFKFIDHHHNKKIEYICQMGSAKLVKKETKL